MTSDAPCPQLESEPLLADLLAYWASKRADGDVPDKQRIEPTEIDRRLLPFIAISELEPEGRVRYRLVGSGIVARHGIDPTGGYLNDVLQGAYRDYILGLHFESAKKRRPIYAEALSHSAEGGYFWARRLVLPLSQGGAEIRFILGAQIFSSPPAQNDGTMRWYESRGGLEELVRVLL